MPDVSPAPDGSPRLPVTVLTGFLGAGKTTLLRHLLTQTEGERWALVVNDVAALNLDAALLATPPASAAGEPAPGATVVPPLVGLSNGCVCCSLQDDLAETLLRLAAAGAYNRVLVETTGVAEPRGLVRLFTRRNPFGRSLGDWLAPEAFVTVVDAAQWLAEEDRAGAAARSEPGAGPRPLFELLVEQVECADVLVLNKCDLVSPAALARVEAAVRGLNPRAELHRAEHAQVAREVVLGRARFDARATPASAAWIPALNALAPAAGGARPPPVAQAVAPGFATRYGLSTVSYQARRPFGRERFHALLAAGLPGVIRAKGFYWLAEQPDEMGFLSLAGGVVRHEWPSWWWAAMIEAGRARREDRPPLILALWQEPHGDRRQELVFIGRDLDAAALRAALDDCLVTGG